MSRGEVHLDNSRLPRWNWKIAAVGGPIITLAFIAAVWAAQVHPNSARVSAVRWEQTTLLQHWTDVVVREWQFNTWQRDEIPPVNGQGERSGKDMLPETCRMEFYEMDRYVCGSHESCTGSGSSRHCHSVPDYCSRPDYRMKCGYRTQLWKTIETKDASGSDSFVRWPQLDAGPLDRLRYTAKYDVVFDYSSGGQDFVHVLNPGNTLLLLGGKRELDESERRTAEVAFTSWFVGREAVLSINNLGMVRDVHPAPPPGLR